MKPSHSKNSDFDPKTEKHGRFSLEETSPSINLDGSDSISGKDRTDFPGEEEILPIDYNFSSCQFSACQPDFWTCLASFQKSHKL